MVAGNVLSSSALRPGSSSLAGSGPQCQCREGPLPTSALSRGQQTHAGRSGEVSAASTPQAPVWPHLGPGSLSPTRTAWECAPSARLPALPHLAPARTLVAPEASSQSRIPAGVAHAGPAWGSDLTTLGTWGQQLSCGKRGGFLGRCSWVLLGVNGKRL